MTLLILFGPFLSRTNQMYTTFLLIFNDMFQPTSFSLFVLSNVTMAVNLTTLKTETSFFNMAFSYAFLVPTLLPKTARLKDHSVLLMI
jgi:hypothetical protein